MPNHNQIDDRVVRSPLFRCREFLARFDAAPAGQKPVLHIPKGMTAEYRAAMERIRPAAVLRRKGAVGA